MKKLLLFFLLFPCLSFATITTAVMTGNWSATEVWDNGVPGCFDTIVIPSSIQVNVTSTVDLTGCANDSIVIIVSGVLQFQNGKKVKLPCDSDLIVNAGASVGVGSGGGSSTYIEICNSQYWNASMGNITGPATLCDGGCVMLPIELMFFNAFYQKNERSVILNWQTKSEIDNDYFELQRSEDGVHFEGFQQIDGAGNSSITLDYMSVDFSPLNGVSYYRLKQVDFNGNYSYSVIKSVSTIDLAVSETIVVAQSVSSNVFCFIDESGSSVQIQLYDAAGKQIYSVEENTLNNQLVTLDLGQDLPIGIYYIVTSTSTIRLMVV